MKADKRKQRLDRRRQDDISQQQANLPMNKHFFNAVDAKGKLLYPLADRVMNYMISGADDLQDMSRQTLVYIGNIRHAIALKEAYEKQYLSTKIKERNKFGEVMTKFELYAQIVSMDINVERDISDIRSLILGGRTVTGDKTGRSFLTLISEDGFTGEMFNKYVLKVSELIHDMGYELFPTEKGIIWAK